MCRVRARAASVRGRLGPAVRLAPSLPPLPSLHYVISHTAAQLHLHALKPPSRLRVTMLRLVVPVLLLRVFAAASESGVSSSASRRLLQTTAPPICYSCPLATSNTALCGALVTVSGVSPYFSGNATSYCKCVPMASGACSGLHRAAPLANSPRERVCAKRGRGSCTTAVAELRCACASSMMLEGRLARSVACCGPPRRRLLFLTLSTSPSDSALFLSC